MPSIDDYDTRRYRQGLLGGEASCWAATTEVTFGKDALYDFIGIASMLWSTQQIPEKDLLMSYRG